MTMTSDGGEIVVDLQCTLTADGGMVLIGGDTTDSTHAEAPVGERVALALQPGQPVEAVMWFEDPPAADSCADFLENVPAADLAEFMAPVEGELVLGP
jgi:hypothetical protein